MFADVKQTAFQEEDSHSTVTINFLVKKNVASVCPSVTEWSELILKETDRQTDRSKIVSEDEGKTEIR